MENFVKTYPRRTKVAMGTFVIYVFDLVLRAFGAMDGIWSFFSDTPPYQWLKEKGASMTPETYWWLKSAIHFCMFILLVKILLTIRQQRREEREYESLQSTVTELRKELTSGKDKLTAFEDTHPRLVVEPLHLSRCIPPDLQPPVPAKDTDSTDSSCDRLSFFAILKVTNKPESHSADAIAHDLYASVSYYDSKWNKLSLSSECPWISLTHPTHGPDYIGSLSERAGSLTPHTSAYLGLVIGMSFPEDDELLKENDDSLLDEDDVWRKYHLFCTPLTTTSQQFSGWIDWDCTFDETNSPPNLCVTVGCNGFRETHCFLLKDYGRQKGLQLEPTEKPNTVS